MDFESYVIHILLQTTGTVPPAIYERAMEAAEMIRQLYERDKLDFYLNEQGDLVMARAGERQAALAEIANIANQEGMYD